MAERSSRSAVLVTWLLAIAAIAAIAGFMAVDTGGRWDLVLRYRADDVVALVLAGICVGVSSVLFQTVTANRILTPGIMGFDALYAMIQAITAFMLASTGLHGIPPAVAFAVDLAAMILIATALYRWLLGDGRRGLHLLVLTGVVLGLLFRSLAAFTGRLAEGGDVTGGALARAFAGMDGDVLAIAAAVLVLAAVAIWWALAALDVLTLGRDAAISLGVDHRAMVLFVLVVSSALAGISTALAGPMIFLGLLAANLAYLATGSTRHAVTLPAAAAIGVIALVGGRLVVERLLDLPGDAGTVINLIGGVAVILMLLKGQAR